MLSTPRSLLVAFDRYLERRDLGDESGFSYPNATMSEAKSILETSFSAPKEGEQILRGTMRNGTVVTVLWTLPPSASPIWDEIAELEREYRYPLDDA